MGFGVLENSGDLQMSTVNYVETLILVGDRFPRRVEGVRELINSSEIQILPPRVIKPKFQPVRACDFRSI